MPRLYGDILSGTAAALIGGVGMAPGVNFGEHEAADRLDAAIATL